MKTQHSLISPSNFERRMLCPGSLNAEKDLVSTTSVYAQEGTMLHERVALSIEDKIWTNDLTNEQRKAVEAAVIYFLTLKNTKNTIVLGEFHEKKYDLSFIYPDMKGTGDSILLLLNEKTQNVEVHVVDYKFGKGVVVEANKNYQLLLYYIGVINDIDIKKLIGDKTISIHLHIVQPFIKNSRWDLSLEDELTFCNVDFYKQIAEDCYEVDAPRIPHKKACQFCKAKSTCSAIARFVPKIIKEGRKISDTSKKIFKNFNND